MKTATRCVHRETDEDPFGAVVPPIYQTVCVTRFQIKTLPLCVLSSSTKWASHIGKVRVRCLELFEPETLDTILLLPR